MDKQLEKVINTLYLSLLEVEMMKYDLVCLDAIISKDRECDDDADKNGGY